LQHLFELAGGIIPSAYTQQMQVERVVKNEKQIVIDINDKTLAKVRDFVLQDADLIKVFSIMDVDANAVYLRGNVKRPGKYSFAPGMKIRDLINQPEDLQSEAHMDYALIKRENPPNREAVLIPFNLGKLILQNDEAYNYDLAPKDQIFVFHQSLFKDQPFVTLEGEVRGFEPTAQEKALRAGQYAQAAPGPYGQAVPGQFGAPAVPGSVQYGQPASGTYSAPAPAQPGTAAPGQYNVAAPRQPAVSPSGQYGQPTAGSYGSQVSGQPGVALPGQYGQTAPAPYGVQVPGQPGAAFPDQYYPYNENLFEIRQIKDTLRFDYEKDKAREKDEIFYLLMAKIEEIEAEIEKDNRVTPGIINQLQIELEKAGRKDLSLRLGKLDEKLKVAIRIDLVGNMKVKDAILNAGGLTANASMESGEIIRQYPNNEFRTTYFNVARAMEGDPRDNLLLQDKDRIVIHSILEKNPRKNIFVTGDVTKPGTYQFTENMTVRDLIFKAGNVLESAYLDEAEITSVSVVNGRLGDLSHRKVNLKKALE